MPASALDPALFRPEAVPPEVKAFNEAFLARMAAAPPIADSSGEARGPLAPRPKSARASVRKVEARGHAVEVRIVAPDNPHGAYLHLHGGGLIMGSADQDDAMLER